MPRGLVRGQTKHLTPPSPHFARTNPVDRGLVGEWRFDPASGLALPDYAGLAAHGIVNGAFWDNERYGPALNFDGDNDYVEIDDINQDHLGADLDIFSVTVFFRKKSHSDWQVLVGHDWGDNESCYQISGDEDGFTAFETSWINGYLVQDANNIGTTDWHHAVMTFDGTTLGGYIDGNLIGTDNTGVYVAANAPTRIARDGAADGYYANALIADVRIYNRALVLGEIRQLYQKLLKRTQPMTHVWMMPWGAVTAVPRTPRPPAAYNTLAVY